MTPAQQARLAIAKTGLQLAQTVTWAFDNYEELEPETSNWLGTVMILTMQYANTTVGILNAPTVNATPAGERCIFY
jgi:hypothetical protein